MNEFVVPVNNLPDNGYYAIVPGTSLTGNVLGESDEHFWGFGRRGTREEYKQLILDSQPFIYKVMFGEVDANDDSYYIYGSTKMLPFLEGKHVDKMSDNAFKGSNWITNPIIVRKFKRKYIYSGNDGLHRFAAARGMNCYVIVFVKIS